MYDGPRNWKWMLPAALAFASGLGGWQIYANAVWRWQDLTGEFLLLLCAVFSLAAVSNYIHYWRYVDSENLLTRQRAMSITPQVLLAEALHGMHPDAIAALNLRAEEAWKVRAGTQAPQYFLDGPSIPMPLEFVAYVLTHSTDYSIMPERLLTEGAKSFDPSRRYTDRDLYRSLIVWWHSQTKCTQALGNSPALWIPPWNPASESAALGLEYHTLAKVE